ncbi:MAG: SAM-dependent chlorinase/fluorinase [Gammaproteobacteria bacterium]|nr:SAM-dependent chlorinase/fluorinase [Gammaproteobacteria bacterium]
MFFLFTDFGRAGPYVGEMHAVLHQQAAGRAVIDLMHDAPRFKPVPASYLLARLLRRLPPGSVTVAVVDPGVGSESRRPVWAEVDGRFLVGPDNGLLDVSLRSAGESSLHEILWRPEGLSNSFHGRDLFAPVAAMLANGSPPCSGPAEHRRGWDSQWPASLPEIVYVDGFGNLMTGIDASKGEVEQAVRIAERKIWPARTFSDVPVGQLFCYANSLGLLEIAANQGNASERLGVGIGEPVSRAEREPER